ncbi:MAG: hypothetical protein MK006_10355 [Pirellulales bacterium]|nr:hypothetical protein [Pirellulales bacterium]|tara:strand:+ start:258 stop:587 length:330 start_codon:yes stop_codon:yes gene_type:complete
MQTRALIGAILTTLAAVLCWQFGPSEWQATTVKVLWRVCIVFWVFWLACPQLKSLGDSLKGETGVLVVLCAVIVVVSKPSAKIIVPMLIIGLLAMGALRFIAKKITDDS